MKIRPFDIERDFDAIKNWISDERTHVLWNANHLYFPLQKDDFKTLMREIDEKFHDAPYAAVSDEGEIVGFFCYSFNIETKEGMLKFVVVDGSKRGMGIGREMIKSAVDMAFENKEAEAVQLNVFSVNEHAKRCYESAGFVERGTTPDAFKYKDESWCRCNMAVKRENWVKA